LPTIRPELGLLLSRRRFGPGPVLPILTLLDGDQPESDDLALIVRSLQDGAVVPA